MKRVLALSFLVMAATVPSAYAEEVPYLADPDQRLMVGEAYGFGGGPAVILRIPGGFLRMVDTFLLFLNLHSLPEVTVDTKTVPNVIEVREPNPPEASYLHWPLRWLFWDSDGDGIADWKAPAIGFEEGDLEKPIFGLPQRISLDLRSLWSKKEIDIRPILKEAGPIPKAAAL